MRIEVFRNLSKALDLHLTQAVYTKRLMAEHNLVFSLTSQDVLNTTIGDYLTYKGEVMTVNQEPKYTQASRNRFEYEITFQGARHTLERFKIKHEGALIFDYFGSLQEHAYMFLECINAVDSGWTFGELEEVEPFLVSYDKVDCYSALNDIAEAARCEWQIEGKQITIKKTVGTARALTLKYGKGNGLYSLSRETLANSAIITRAYGVGGSQNLPQGYGKKQLTLDGYLDDPTSTALYGIREGVFEDQSIFPNRTGSITAVEQINEKTFSISDTSIDFDLNGQRIDGTEAKIVFKSGALNGQEFTILSYNDSTKTIRYKANEDSNGKLVPFGNLVAEIGDQYTLIGIRMPDSYVTAALAELKAKRLEYLNSNKVPRVVYELDTDVLWLKRQNTELHEGDIVHVIDEKIGLDDNIRVTSVSYPAMFPNLQQGMKFTAEIANEVTYTRTQKIEKDIKETKEVVTQVSKSSIENDRRNIQALNEFKGLVFDPDGELENPFIQAIAGLFGTDSMYYDLENIAITLNSGDNPNAISMTAGKLIHKRYKVDGLGYIWDMPAFSRNGLSATTPYYLAAKCSKTALTGEWILTTDQQSIDSFGGYWVFNLGVLSSVIEGKRSFRPTKMFTMISGGNIETDTITAYFINVVKLFAQVITVGSDGFVNAGISGESDNGNQSVRFWAGSDAENRRNAPFRVLNDGSMQAFKGAIGGFNVDQHSLRAGRDDTWEVNGKSVFLTPEYFLLRDNGAIRGQRREMSWNLYKEVLGSPISATTSIFNTIATADQFAPYTNIALELEARNGNHNYAMVVKHGTSRMRAICHDFQNITGQNQTIDDGVSMVIIPENVVPSSIYLPSYPKLGYEVTIKNISPNDFALRSNNGSIIQLDGSPTTANGFRRRSIKTFFFNGQY